MVLSFGSTGSPKSVFARWLLVGIESAFGANATERPNRGKSAGQSGFGSRGGTI